MLRTQSAQMCESMHNSARKPLATADWCNSTAELTLSTVTQRTGCKSPQLAYPTSAVPSATQLGILSLMTTCGEASLLSLSNSSLVRAVLLGPWKEAVCLMRSPTSCQSRLDDTSWLTYSSASAAAGCPPEVLFILYVCKSVCENVQAVTGAGHPAIPGWMTLAGWSAAWLLLLGAHLTSCSSCMYQQRCSETFESRACTEHCRRLAT